MQIQTRPDIEDVKPFYNYEAIKVTCDADLTTAAQALKEIKSRYKAIEDWRKEVVGPIKQGIKAFEDRVRIPKDILERLEGIIKGRMESYWDAQRQQVLEVERQRRQAEIEAAKQLANENLDTAMSTGSEVAKEAAIRFDQHAERLETKPLDVSQTVRAGNVTVAQSLVWEWEIVDLSKVPRELLVLDEKTINGVAKNYNEKPIEIPGIVFKQVSRASVR